MRYSEGRFITKQMKRSNRNGLIGLLCLLAIFGVMLYFDFEMICSNLTHINTDFGILKQEMITIDRTEKVLGGSTTVDYAINKYIDKRDVYEQYPFYRFRVKPDIMAKTSVEYGTYNEGVMTPAYGLSIAEYDGVKFGVIHKLGLDVSKTKTFKGLWIKMPSYIKNDMGYDLSDGESFETINYYFDARGGTFVDLDGRDFMFYRIYMIFVLIIAFFVIRNLIIPKKSFTYNQLTKYGPGEQIAAELDKEIPEDFQGKQLTTETWVVEKKWFRTKVIKNHRKKTKFDE